ncbi:chemotaxis protein CheA [Fibrobacterota bacterium]
MKNRDEAMLNELVIESREQLSRIEPDLLALEKGGEVPRETINRIFRAVHSVKGGFSFFGMVNIKDLTHVIENVLMKIRDGELEVGPSLVDALLAGLDKLRVMLDDVKNSERIDFSKESKLLLAFEETKISPEEKSEVKTRPEKEGVEEDNQWEDADIESLPLSPEILESTAEKRKHLYLIAVQTKKHLLEKERSTASFIKELQLYGDILHSDPDIFMLAEQKGGGSEDQIIKIVFATALKPNMLIPEIKVDERYVQWFRSGEVRESIRNMKNIRKQKNPEKTDKTGEAALSGNTENTESIRVKVNLLDKIVDLAGELVLGRNQLVRQLKDLDMPGLNAIIQNINMVTSDLQENIMNTRMQPIGNIFGMFMRIVRDMARQLHKEIEISFSGENVEMDKSILEALTDPLVHLVRNCVDHGIETSAERKKQGKRREGHILLSASHQSGQINIEIKDDGKGIDLVRVKDKAVEMGILTREAAETTSDQDAYLLLFEPGFSTAGEVTETSGRGVGLDVVKTNIEKLSGVIELSTQRGKGTTVFLKLPLTLAIIPSLMVTSEERQFAIPQVCLEQLVHIRANEVSSRIEKVQGHEVIRLREKLLPVVRLNQVLDMEETFIHPGTKERKPDARKNLSDRRDKIPPAKEIKEKRKEQEDRRQSFSSGVNIAVLKAGSNRYGLLVEKFLNNEEIVVKPLSMYIKKCKSYSGVTILGNGKIAMILDSAGIAEQANLQFGELAGESEKQALEYARKSENKTWPFLIFRSSRNEVLSIELSKIARVEKVKADAIEKIGDQEYLKYSDTSLRIIRPYDYMPIKRPESVSEFLYVIVPKQTKFPVGIVAVKVIDVIDISPAIDNTSLKGTGIEGSMVINDTLIVVMDVHSLLEAVNHESSGVSG